MEEEEGSRKGAWAADGPEAKVRRLDPSIDLQADTFDTRFTEGGHGIARRAEDPTGADPIARDGLIVQANKHGDAVMTAMAGARGGGGGGAAAAGAGGAAAAAAAVEEEEKVRHAARLAHGQMEAMEDLVGEVPEEFEVLNVAGPSSSVRPGDAGAPGAADAFVPGAADLEEHAGLLRWLRGAGGPADGRVVITRGLSCGAELLSDMAHRISRGRCDRPALAALDSGDGALPKEVLGELTQLAAYTHELLRHYWSAIQRYIGAAIPEMDARPPAETLGRRWEHRPGRDEDGDWRKAARVQRKLGEVSDALQGGLRGLPPKQRQRAGGLVTSLVRSIEKSSDHWIELSE